MLYIYIYITGSDGMNRFYGARVDASYFGEAFVSGTSTRGPRTVWQSEE